MFEGQDRLDSAPRTLIVTDRMREILGGIGEKAVVNEIRQFELFTDGRVAKIALRRPDLVIERSTLIGSWLTLRPAPGRAFSSGKKSFP